MMGVYIPVRGIKVTAGPGSPILHSSIAVYRKACCGIPINGNLNPRQRLHVQLLEGSKRLLMRLKISIALFLALAPSLAFAKPRTATARMHPQLFRDRSPKPRMRDTRARGLHGVPIKAPPVVSQGDPF